MARVKSVKKSQNLEELLSFVENLKRQWMATIDALVDPLMIISHDYAIRKANVALARKAQLEIRELIGRKCYEIFANRKSPCKGCKLKESIQTTKAQSFDLESDTSREFYEVSSQPLFNDSGEVDGIVHIYRDRTEAKQLREQLLQSEKLSSIGLLAGGIAHEINNPLGGILVFSQMLLRELPEASSHRTDAAEILSAAERCKSIVENLLDFARTNRQGRKSKTSINVIETVRSALRFAKVSIPQNLIRIEELVEDGNAEIKADKNSLIQLFLNLIQNAVQAMPKGGTLSISSSLVTNKDQSKWIKIDIKDTGIGIPSANLKKIFDPFFTTKEPGEGTGLGLSICYGIVEELGGTLTVRSKAGEGTCFTTSLPVAMKPRLNKAG